MKKVFLLVILIFGGESLFSQSKVSFKGNPKLSNDKICSPNNTNSCQDDKDKIYIKNIRLSNPDKEVGLVKYRIEDNANTVLITPKTIDAIKRGEKTITMKEIDICKDIAGITVGGTSFELKIWFEPDGTTDRIDEQTIPFTLNSKVDMEIGQNQFEFCAQRLANPSTTFLNIKLKLIGSSPINGATYEWYRNDTLIDLTNSVRTVRGDGTIVTSGTNGTINIGVSPSNSDSGTIGISMTTGEQSDDNGRYKVKIISPGGCESESKEVEMKIGSEKTVEVHANIMPFDGGMINRKPDKSFFVCPSSVQKSADTVNVPAIPAYQFGIGDTNDIVRAYWFKKKDKNIIKEIGAKGIIDTAQANTFRTQARLRDEYLGAWETTGEKGLDIGNTTFNTGDTVNIPVAGGTGTLIGNISINNPRNPRKRSLGIQADNTNANSFIKLLKDPNKDKIDGWYYLVAMYDGKGRADGLCTAIDSFQIKLPTFNTMRAVLNKKRDGALCGGEQGQERLEVEGISTKDKYGDTPNYEYEWIYLTNKTGTKFGLNTTETLQKTPKGDISACNITQLAKHTPLFVLVSQDGCPYENNIDTTKLRTYLEGEVNKDTYQDYIIRRDIIMKPNFAYNINNNNPPTAIASTLTGLADSLWLPVSQHPLPKISFNFAKSDGIKIKKLAGKKYLNNDPVPIVCNKNTSGHDSVYTYTLCPDSTLYILLESEGEGSTNSDSVKVIKSTIKLKGAGGDIPSETTKTNNGFIYKIENITQTSNYTIEAETDKGCKIYTDKKLIIKPISDAIDLSYNENACVGDTVELSVKGGLDYTLALNNKQIITNKSDSTVTFKIPYTEFATMPERITVSSKTNSGCFVTQTILVNIQKNENLSVNPMSVEANYGESETFQATGGSKYFWFNSDDFLDTISKTEVLEVTPSSSEEYTLIAEDTKGCIYSIKGIKFSLINDPSSNTEEGKDFEEEFEKDESGASNQVITPNGDGINEGMIIPEKYTKPYYEFIVMNRYGDVVYRKSNYQNGDFKGQSNRGNNLPDGTYYYQLVHLQKGVSKKGFITILNGN